MSNDMDEYAEARKLYKELAATNPAISIQGATVPNTTVNGHMFSYLSKAGVVALRLPADIRTTFLNKYQTLGTEEVFRLKFFLCKFAEA